MTQKMYISSTAKKPTEIVDSVMQTVAFRSMAKEALSLKHRMI